MSIIPSSDLQFTFVRVGPTKLLLPRMDVRVLELALDIVDANEPPPRGVGWLILPGNPRCPVYCCSDQLEWLSTARRDTPICAVLTTDGHDFALLCTEALLMNPTGLWFHDVPLAMRTPTQPFVRMATSGTDVFCVTSAQRLWLDVKGSSWN